MRVEVSLDYDTKRAEDLSFSRTGKRYQEKDIWSFINRSDSREEIPHFKLFHDFVGVNIQRVPEDRRLEVIDEIEERFYHLRDWLHTPARDIEIFKRSYGFYGEKESDEALAEEYGLKRNNVLKIRRTVKHRLKVGFDLGYRVLPEKCLVKEFLNKSVFNKDLPQIALSHFKIDLRSLSKEGREVLKDSLVCLRSDSSVIRSVGSGILILEPIGKNKQNLASKLPEEDRQTIKDQLKEYLEKRGI